MWLDVFLDHSGPVTIIRSFWRVSKDLGQKQSQRGIERCSISEGRLKLIYFWLERKRKVVQQTRKDARAFPLKLENAMGPISLRAFPP